MTDSSARPDKSDRHARSGDEAAQRVFADLVASGEDDPDFDSDYQAALNLVLNGPAPQAFKDGFRDSMERSLAARSQR